MFIQERIVQASYDGQVRCDVLADHIADGRKERFRPYPVFLEQTVGCAPIRKLLAAGAEQSGDGSSSQASKHTEHKRSGPGPGSVLMESGFRLRPERFYGIGKRQRVFFSADGGVSFLFSTIWLLSSMTHSTTSPFSNSIA